MLPAAAAPPVDAGVPRIDAAAKAARIKIAARHPHPGWAVPAVEIVIAKAGAEAEAEAHAPGNARRDWRPAHDIIGLAPGDPAWAPGHIGHPHPAHGFIKAPAAIMIGGPAPGIAGQPEAVIQPLPVLIRAPAIGGIGHEHNAPLRRLQPAAILAQRLAEHFDAGHVFRAPLRAGLGGPVGRIAAHHRLIAAVIARRDARGIIGVGTTGQRGSQQQQDWAGE